MLNPQAKAAAATEEPNGRSVSEVVRDGRRWCSVAGTTAHRSRSTHRTGLLVLFEGCRQGYSHYQTQVDGLPIWGMSAEKDAGPTRRAARVRVCARSSCVQYGSVAGAASPLAEPRWRRTLFRVRGKHRQFTGELTCD